MQVRIILKEVASILFLVFIASPSTYAEEGEGKEREFRYIAKFKGPDERKAFRDEKNSNDLIIKSIPRSESEVLKFESLEDVENWEEAHRELLDYLEEGKELRCCREFLSFFSFISNSIIRGSNSSEQIRF